MMKNFVSVCVLISSLVCSFSNNSEAGRLDLDTLFELLKDRASDTLLLPDPGAIGDLCEEIALISLAEFYPLDKYEILNSIRYREKGKPSKGIIGELDIVVFTKDDDKQAVLVGEVKCNPAESNYEKAIRQMNRFKKMVAQNRIPLEFYLSSNPDSHFDQSQFMKSDTKTISFSRGINSGFDLILEYSLDEVVALKERIYAYRMTDVSISRAVSPTGRLRPVSLPAHLEDLSRPKSRSRDLHQRRNHLKLFEHLFSH